MQLRQIAATVFMVLILIFCPADEGNAAETVHETLNDVYAERNYQRAKEATLWSQPAMGVAMTLGAIKNLGGHYNDIAYLS